ncbi:MAG: transketolase [Chloroflexia bacterium]
MVVAQTQDRRALEELCINTIRTLSIDAVQKANSGHPGMPLGAAAMAYVIWTKFLKHSPANPGWPDRDRFVLSAGHGSMLLYSLLHLTGYDLSLDEIKNFRQWGSLTPGHPERELTPGVEVTTGPLGQGFANGVGMAIAEQWLAAHYNRPGHTIVDHYTYGIVSDGDLMEGVAYEAASLAGHLGLGKLIYLYDQNHITLAGAANLSFSEDVAARFAAVGWHTQEVTDGNDTEAIATAITAARAEHAKPSLILVRTHIGFGSPKKQDSFEAHGSPLGADEVAATKRALEWPTTDAFYLPDEAVTHFREAIDLGVAGQREWQARFDAYAKAFPAEAAEWHRAWAGELPADLDAELPKWDTSEKPVSTRVAGGRALTALAGKIPNLIGGSADLNPSTNTSLKGMGDFQNPAIGEAGAQGSVGGAMDFSGRNIHFGIREHAMGSSANGMAAHGGVIPFTATFLVFSDYMKPAIRLGAISHLHAIYVFTHDSIAVGEDGPTHEPVEHLAGLRAIPNLSVFRPGDANETAEAWAAALRRTDGPTLFAFSRQNLPILDRSGARGSVAQGAYVLKDAEGGDPEVILIGTGSEVALCVDAAKRLGEYGVRARVVSMPSWDRFQAQDRAYRDDVLPPGIRARVTVEAAATFGWERWAGTDGAMIGIDRFGASAPGDTNLKKFGFTIEHVASTALRVLGRDDDAAAESAKGGEIVMAPTSPKEGHS